MGEPRSSPLILHEAPPFPAVAMAPNNCTDEPSWINTVRKKVNEARPGSETGGPCTIFTVPGNIRRCDSKAYEPTVVSIGPNHYRVPSRRGTGLAMQVHKWSCVRYLLSRHRSQRRAGELLDRCLVELKALDAQVRSCYSDNIYLDPQTLASVMLHDACFIIHLLLKQVNKEIWKEVGSVVEEKRKEEEEEEKIEGKETKAVEGEVVVLEVGEVEEEIESPLLGMLWVRNLVLYDLLKLENQIPFFVIQTLFDLLKTPEDKGIDLAELALKLFSNIHPNKSQAFTTLPGDKVHLLHLFHSSLIPSEHEVPSSAGVKECAEWIPSATELKLAGVKFSKRKASSFLDITFKDGIMEIPPLRVDDYMNSLFRNLIAFEQCYPDIKTYITIYTAFMNCIIATAEDVRLLDSKGIVANRLSTDDAVADFFNQLCNQIHFASDRNYLQDVYSEVNKCHESKWRKWRAVLMRDYFGSPWAIILLLAGVVLLMLTIQQSFFAAYSYFHRR